MAKYQIVEPCIYIADGQTVQHREPGALVDLDSKTAEALGSAVKPVGKPEVSAPVEHQEKKPLRPKLDTAAAPDSDPKPDHA